MIRGFFSGGTPYGLTKRCGDIDQTAEGSPFIVFMVETHKTDAVCVGAES